MDVVKSAKVRHCSARGIWPTRPTSYQLQPISLNPEATKRDLGNALHENEEKNDVT